MTKLWSITEVAEAFDLSVATLRYYEEQGIISPTTRVARVRYYDHASLCTLAYALLWHNDAGLSLGDTRELMQPRPSAERNVLITQHLGLLDEKIRLLEGAKNTLEHLLNCPSEDPEHCARTGSQLRATVDTAVATQRPGR